VRNKQIKEEVPCPVLIVVTTGVPLRSNRVVRLSLLRILRHESRVEEVVGGEIFHDLIKLCPTA
jgi:hypothetical protein